MKVYGLIGKPVSHSLSPVMHNALFRKYGIDAVYVTFEVEELGKAIDGVRALGISGLNVTMPYKEVVTKFLDELSEDAREINSVNTIINLEGSLIGYTTDGVGARKALERFTEIEGRNVLILGAGGAGKAIAYELSKIANIVVLNRTPSKAKSLEKFGVKGGSLDELPNYVGWADVLINATSVGMGTNESLVPRRLLRRELIVMDIVYKPLKTRLLRDAESVGCRVIDGLWMLIYQGAESFKLWTGIYPDVELMRRVSLERLGKG
ncbi:shikimate dehydrogenase [Pyrococcus abyssi]|uniref:Shikimate dehydrogenase (NADP(+)) n=1 Tax=Pyrococcus abyssi (strain GE5 / Orsay) TaxID=272844 RepID=AROE_PYRAB|nr:shikimate dehydrogenase [Pyrococcus abyssi]Q9V1H7.1 RecName: Full=Shikimate dehydrogenase (NADP(+)); Short=SDH [Pyrococcus abyssi GE5]CAB49372.1 aroE shikimate 5-dehydrogenase [Pyrococcus abyssi GE5]CCE69833.1 TPA: shikimate 5-dehydrogenase [Pyrococcus abyssi GE5]